MFGSLLVNLKADRVVHDPERNHRSIPQAVVAIANGQYRLTRKSLNDLPHAAGFGTLDQQNVTALGFARRADMRDLKRTPVGGFAPNYFLQRRNQIAAPLYPDSQGSLCRTRRPFDEAGEVVNKGGFDPRFDDTRIVRGGCRGASENGGHYRHKNT